MANNIVFTTESTSDIPKEYQEKYGIKIINAHVSLDGVDYIDGENIRQADILNAFEEKQILPKTSAPGVQEYADCWKPLLDEGKTIIHISLSSGIASDYQNANIAKEDLEAEGKVYIVDSKSLAGCIGNLVYKGADLAAEGKEAPEIVAELEEAVTKLDSTFVITTLTFLVHGGRASALEAFGANLLKLKPMIEMADGVMNVAKKYRGSDLKVYQEYIDERLADGNYDNTRCTLCHVAVDSATMKSFANQLKKKYGFKEVVVGEVGCAITAHGGPGAFCFGFLRK